MKRLLVTGASGTLGYNVVRLVASECPDVTVLLAMRRPLPELFADLPNVSIARWDMFDQKRTAQLLGDFLPDAIVHCAAGGVRPSAARDVRAKDVIMKDSTFSHANSDSTG